MWISYACKVQGPRSIVQFFEHRVGTRVGVCLGDIAFEIVQVTKLGSALARQNGDEEGVTVQRLFQQLSVALMRGNAALLNNRCPANYDNNAGSDIM